MSRRLILSGRRQLLTEITNFCRAVYYRTFSPEEAEKRLAKLTFVSAVQLWQSGLPHSRLQD
jgi:hypothetical protein